MKISVFIFPILIILLFIFAFIKKIKLYDTFAEGAKGAISLAFNIFPYIFTMFVMTELFTLSGLSDRLSTLLEPVLRVLGVPIELSELLLIKPFSGSGSLASLTEIYSLYGVDSYIGRCASIIYGTGETIFYISAVYFAGIKNKKTIKAVFIALIANFIGCVIGCFLCLII